MAMTLRGESDLPANQDAVWLKLNDPDVLRQCIPGCQSLERDTDTSFKAIAKIKVGPVSASFKGSVQLLDIDPPNGYRIQGEGEGGIAGFAKGGAKVWLAANGDGTRLSYDVERRWQVAQLGSRLIDGVARKMADQFFTKFAEIVAQTNAAGASEHMPADTTSPAVASV